MRIHQLHDYRFPNHHQIQQMTSLNPGNILLNSNNYNTNNNLNHSRNFQNNGHQFMKRPSSTAASTDRTSLVMQHNMRENFTNQKMNQSNQQQNDVYDTRQHIIRFTNDLPSFNMSVII
jgi:hypothetical protein